jgi:hypothetical protein
MLHVASISQGQAAHASISFKQLKCNVLFLLFSSPPKREGSCENLHKGLTDSVFQSVGTAIVFRPTSKLRKTSSTKCKAGLCRSALMVEEVPSQDVLLFSLSPPSPVD